MLKKIATCGIFTLLLMGPTGHTMGAFSAVGAVQNQSGEKSGYGGGLLLGFRLVPRLSFETGGVFVAASPHSVYVPVDLRFHLTRHISLSGGGYFQHFSESGVSMNRGLEGGLRLSFGHLFLDGRYLAGANSSVMGMLGIVLGLF